MRSRGAGAVAEAGTRAEVAKGQADAARCHINFKLKRRIEPINGILSLPLKLINWTQSEASLMQFAMKMQPGAVTMHLIGRR